MFNVTVLILTVAFFQIFSADGQSTFGSCEANVLIFLDEMQSKIVDEIRNSRNREHVCSNRCTQIEDQLGRHLNNITQTLQTVNTRLGKLDEHVQNAVSASARQGKCN